MKKKTTTQKSTQKSKPKATRKSAGIDVNRLNFTLVDHPVLVHKLTVLRNKKNSSMAFRQIVEEMSQLLGYEATRDLVTKPMPVETPLEKTQSPMIQEDVVIVAILRAGLGMLGAMMKILPFATVGHIGIYRDRFVNATIEYYLRLPRSVKGRKTLLLDPMLASGDTACAAIDRLKEHKVGSIRLISIIAAPQGIQQVNARHPDVEIYTISLERDLNAKGYILPGVGDAGDRLYDT